MKCPNCEKEIANDSIFCEFCGTRIKKSKKALWITLSVIFVVAIVAIAVVNIQNQQEEAERQAKLARKQKLFNQGYVDLGLSSGTYWKATNESGFYDYDAAVSKFGNKLPTKKQLEELKNECEWTWMGNGYKVTGPNGYSITLPAAGYRHCSGSVSHVGTYGYYWSSTPDDSHNAWDLSFGSSGVYMCNYNRCYGRSVRLVQNL